MRVFLTTLLVLSVSATAAPDFRPSPKGFDVGEEKKGKYPYGSKTHAFEVIGIDFDKQVVAFRHLYSLWDVETDMFGDTPQSKVNCGYDGMSSDPKAGVVLGIYSIKEDRSDWTFVYRSVFAKKWCMTKAESKKNLDQMKSKMVALGFDPAKRVTGISLLKEDNPGKWGPHDTQEISIEVAGKTRKLRLENSSMNFLLANDGTSDQDREFQGYEPPFEKLSPQAKKLFELCRSAAGDARDCGISMARLVDAASGRVLWERKQMNYLFEKSAMGDWGTFRLPMAFVSGKKVIFLEHFHHSSTQDYNADWDIFAFTPPIEFEL